MTKPGLPEGLLLTFYGDDFTGSTDAMEAMQNAGVDTVLFLQAPKPTDLARFPNARCVGLAGQSRSRSPEWMDEHLPPIFQSLWALGAPLLHYKVCSTYDSSPSMGSIGRATELGLRVVGGAWSPSIVGVPQLKRYQAFGNLFAAVNGVAYRLDRHPTMSRHPVTPMDEGDLRRHLAKQTALPIELIDLVNLVSLSTSNTPAVIAHLGQGGESPIVFIDVVDDATQQKAGALVWEGRGQGLFSASSSGLGYALCAYWRSRGWLSEPVSPARVAAVPAIAAVSGSCSPVTAEQIGYAEAHGFKVMALDLDAALRPHSADAEIERCVRFAQASLSRGESPLVASARGPNDPAVLNFDAVARQAGLTREQAASRVGQALGRIMLRLLERTKLPRVVVAGGDSSGEVMSALGVDALTLAAPLAPGVPLCIAHAQGTAFDSLQIALKGGQLGGLDFFVKARDGTA